MPKKQSVTGVAIVPIEVVERQIYIIRGQKVIIDADLAARIEKIEASQDQHASVINILAEEIDNLKQLPPDPPKRRIGFATTDTDSGEE